MNKSDAAQDAIRVIQFLTWSDAISTDSAAILINADHVRAIHAAAAHLRWLQDQEIERMRQHKKNGEKGGRPRSRKKRCPCGEMTYRRAKARNHINEDGTCKPIPKKKTKISE